MSEPLWLTLARGDLGVSETPGPKSNPEILEMFKDSGHPEISSEDTAWCAAYAGAMLHRAGINPTGSLMARSYLKWGDKLDAPKAGCVAVLWRGHPDSDTGHVGFVVSFDADSIELLGGNQGAAGVVSIEHFPRSRVLGWRWPRADETPAEGGAGPGAKSPSTSEKPLQIKAAPLGGSGAVLAGKSTKGTTTMNPLSILTSLIGALVPTVKNSPSPLPCRPAKHAHGSSDRVKPS